VAEEQLEQPYARYYQRWHDGSPEQEKRQVDYFTRLILDKLPVDTDAPLLDVGCGTGDLLVALQRLGYSNILGVDRDSELVDIAHQRNLPVTQSGDAEDFLRLHPDTYTMVFAMDVLEHLPPHRQLRFCQSMLTSMKPGGRLLITVPNANASIAARWRYNDLTHHTSFTESSLDHLLYLAGCTEVVVEAQELMPTPPWYRLFTPHGVRWILLKLLRGRQRLEMLAEFGRQEGASIPLSPNLMASARKPAP